MGRKAVGVFLLAAILGGSAWAYLALSQRLLDREHEGLANRTSDAGRFTGELRLAGDGWIGYFALRSPHFNQILWSGGLKYAWTDDKAAYAERMAKFAAGGYDFIVATVDTWLLHGATAGFPGVIVAVIDESQGGDAIVGGPNVASLDDLARPGVRIAFTPASPSEYLLKATAVHFDLGPLRTAGPWRVETNGSEEALEKLRRGEVQAAVLWEPQVSQALKLPGCRKLTSTKESADLIVDVLIARRELLEKDPAKVRFVVQSYLQALYHYRSDPERLRSQAARDGSVDTETAQAMLDGVSLFGLRDNARQWFALGTEGGFRENRLALQILDTVQVLRDAGDLRDDPLKGNAFAIVNSGPLEELVRTGWSPDARGGAEPDAQGRAAPRELDEAGWSRLRAVGHLPVLPVYFSSGSDALTEQDQVALERLARILRHYPDYRIHVKGHASPGSDPEADRQLSALRADAVRRQLVSGHGIEGARIRALGLGADQPLERRPGESTRAWRDRQQRVEILLLEENF